MFYYRILLFYAFTVLCFVFSAYATYIIIVTVIQLKQWNFHISLINVKNSTRYHCILFFSLLDLSLFILVSIIQQTFVMSWIVGHKLIFYGWKQVLKQKLYFSKIYLDFFFEYYA